MSDAVEKAHAEMMAAVQKALPNHGKMVLNQVYAIAETFCGKVSNIRRSEFASVIATQSAQIEGLKAAIQKIADLSRPGQQIDIYQAIDILTDIWNLAQCPSLSTIPEAQK